MTTGDPWCAIHGQTLCLCHDKEKLAYGHSEFVPFATPTPIFTPIASVTSDLEKMKAMLDAASIIHSSHNIPKKRADGDSDIVNYSEKRSPEAVSALRIKVGKDAAGYARFYTLFIFDAEGKLLGHEAWE